MQQKLGCSLIGLGEPGKAIVLLEKARATRQATLGPDHPDTLTSMNDLATPYQAAGKLDLALPLLEETLKLKKAALGPKHPDTLQSMNNLAKAYQDAGKLDLAVPLFEETLKLKKAKLGPEHPETLTGMNNLALAYQHAGKRDLALPLFEETLRLMKAKLGPEHPDTLNSSLWLVGGNLKVNDSIAGHPPYFTESSNPVASSPIWGNLGGERLWQQYANGTVVGGLSGMHACSRRLVKTATSFHVIT
jgi:tetratricopeptide (TPR) repeat protein